MKEKRRLYNKKLEPTNKFYYKGDPIPNNYYPMVVMIAIENSVGKFLMQKRVKSKGGDWGVTGGHPKYYETPLEGIITEVKEELGLDISKEQIQKFDYGCDGKDCYIMYYIKLNIDIDSLEIQKEELTEVRWFSIEELNSMVKNSILNQEQIDFFNKCILFLNTKK